MDRWPEDGSTDVDRDVGNSSRKVPFSIFPENTDEKSGSDIFTEGHECTRIPKVRLTQGLKRTESAYFVAIALAKIAGRLIGTTKAGFQIRAAGDWVSTDAAKAKQNN